MNETNTPRPRKQKRSFLWLWILLLLAAFTGGIVLGLNLNTLPLPNDVQNRLYPVLEAMIPGSTAVRPEQAAPAATPSVTAAPAETPAPVETPTPVPPETDLPPAPVIEEPVKEAPPQEEEIVETLAARPADTETFDAAPAKYIGVDAALEAALRDAEVDKKDATVNGVFRTRDENGQLVYEVSFTVGEFSYEYVVEASDGEILGWKESGFHFADTETFGTDAALNADSTAAAEEVKKKKKML